MNNMRLLIIAIIILKTFTITSAMATSNTDSSYNEILNKYQNIIDEYKKYLSSVPDDVKKELIDYRKKIIEINDEKKKIHKSLSKKAQSLLVTEYKFKRDIAKLSKKDKESKCDKAGKDKSEKK